MRPKIALDYRPALLSRAGIGRVTRELARALAARDDVEVHLFAHSLAPARVPCAVPAGARLHRLPIPGRTLPVLARLGLFAERLAGGAALFHWTDYVHPPVGGAKVVLTVHDLAFVRDASWHGPAAATLGDRTRAAIARADAVVVPSQATAADVRAFAPDVRALQVIPFGADHVPAGPRPPHPLGGRPYALCLGTLEPRKNHAALLRAWRLLPADRPLLVVVGGIGWQCDDVVAALRAAVADGVAVWHADCADAAMWTWLRNAELLVYPSLWEGFGLPPLEALAAGVRVVVNDTPVLRETLGDAAAFVDATDPEALAAGVRTALAAPARAGARPRLPTWRQCAADHAALYREMLA
ncbi:MAG: glycosyltransferase family 1 protein [Planctomycetota bacterium]